jgi:hypothetical protein
MWKARLLSITCLLYLLLGTSAWAAPSGALPDKAAIAASQEWRELLLKQGGAGLYPLLDKQALGKRAGLSALDTRLLPRLESLLGGEPPQRVRVYWVAADHAWLARLDFAHRSVNFLRLDVDAANHLLDWYDYNLGVSLSGLLQSAAAQRGKLEAFLDALDKPPLAALATIDPASSLARLVTVACLNRGCYEKALERLPVQAGEVSLLALEKATLAKDFAVADKVMAGLEAVLGDDPAVVWLGASLAITEGRCKQAMALVTPALARWPSEPRLYPLASQCQMRLHQPQQALATLRAMQAHTGSQIDWDELVKEPLYAPLKPLLQPR